MDCKCKYILVLYTIHIINLTPEPGEFHRLQGRYTHVESEVVHEQGKDTIIQIVLHIIMCIATDDW